MKIKNEQVHQAYSIAKRVYSVELTSKEAGEELSQKYGMNKNSALDCIYVFQQMLNGQGYKRTINAYGTEYYLKNIEKDYGGNFLDLAISSVKKNLEYYEEKGKSSQQKIQKILEIYSSRTKNWRTLEDVQMEFDREIKKSRSGTKESRKKRLRAQPPRSKPKTIQVLAQVFIRNPDVVAEVLDRANGICERCGNPAPFMKAKDGSPYLEVHHKVQLADDGEDTVENAIGLCPNCHRKLHFGKQT